MKDKNGHAFVSIGLNVIVVLVSILLIYIFGSKAFAFGANIFDEKAMTTVENAIEVSVTIPVSASTDSVCDALYDKGLILDKNVFKVQVMLSDYKGKFQAGTYTVNTSMKPTQIMAVLCNESLEGDKK